jgi:hypothetical protein
MNDNPLIRREWLSMRRNWLRLGGVMAIAVAMEMALQSLFYYQLFPANVIWGHLSYLLRLAIRVPMLVGLYLMLETLGRERRGGGWKELVMTGLSAGQLVRGKVVLPILYLIVLNLVLIPWSYYKVLKMSATAQADMMMIFLTSLPGGLVEDICYATAVCLVVFRFGWRRPAGEAILKSVGVLLGLGLWIVVVVLLAEVVLMTFASLLAGPGWILRLVYQGLYLPPMLAAEIGLAIWAYRASVRDLREGLREDVV